MKIQLQNTHFYPALGGIENYLYYASKTLIELNNKPIILCSQHLSNLPLRDIYDGIEIVRYPTIGQSSKWLFLPNSIYYLKNLEKVIASNIENVDMILTRHPYLAYASCKTTKKTPIFYVQATVWPSFLKEISKKSSGTKKMISKIGELEGYYIEKKAMELCDKIIVLSQIRMKEISEYYNIPQEKFEIIPPGIDLERFKPRKKDELLLKELNLLHATKIVLTVCRLSPEKNIGMLINAFGKIKYKDTCLVVVGDGPEKIYLEKLVNSLNINSKVKFVGSRTDTERFYSIADVFVLSSVYEGFGQVFLEAMASGLPCIGLKPNYPKVIVASKEIIQEGETGYCVDSNSVEDLSKKIETIISNDILKKKMGEQARIVCEHKYSWEMHVNKIIDLYLQTIKNKNTI